LCALVYGNSTIAISSRGARIQKKISNWKDRRDRNVIKQKYDYSCGASALATLLTFHFGEETSEKRVMELILKDKTQTEIEKIIKEGFSLLGLKEATEKLGYFGGMYRLKLKHLKKLRAPVILFIQPKGYRHFVVFKGIKGDRVYLADPSRGNVRISIHRFQEEWEGITLAIDKKEISSFADFLHLPSSPYVCPEIFTIKFLFPMYFMH